MRHINNWYQERQTALFTRYIIVVHAVLLLIALIGQLIQG